MQVCVSAAALREARCQPADRRVWGPMQYPHATPPCAAARIMTEGMCGLRQGYIILAEPLPLPAKLGAEQAGGGATIHYSLDKLLQQHMERAEGTLAAQRVSSAGQQQIGGPPGPPPSGPPGPPGLPPGLSVAVEEAAHPSAPSTSTSSPSLALGPRILQSEEALLAGAPLVPSADYEFELFMQQDARLMPVSPGDSAVSSDALAGPLPPQLLDLAAAQVAAAAVQQPARVTRLKEV